MHTKPWKLKPGFINRVLVAVKFLRPRNAFRNSVFGASKLASAKTPLLNPYCRPHAHKRLRSWFRSISSVLFLVHLSWTASQRAPNAPKFAQPSLSRSKPRSSPAKQTLVWLFLYGWSSLQCKFGYVCYVSFWHTTWEKVIIYLNSVLTKWGFLWIHGFWWRAVFILRKRFLNTFKVQISSFKVQISSFKVRILAFKVQTLSAIPLRSPSKGDQAPWSLK